MLLECHKSLKKYDFGKFWKNVLFVQFQLRCISNTQKKFEISKLVQQLEMIAISFMNLRCKERQI